MVGRRPRHQRARRAGGGRDEPRQGDPPSGARRGAALCLATGAAALADVAGRAGARRVCRRRLLAVVRRFADRRDLPCWPRCCWARRWSCRRCWSCVLSLGQRSARRPLACWFWADSRQQLSGLSLALMALLLALAVNVGVGTMVESFSRTFIGWLDGRLAADVYVNAARRRAGDRDQGLAARAARGARRSCPAAAPTRKSAARRSRFSACADHATYREHWPLLQSAADAWDRLRAGRCRAGQRATGAAAETRPRRPHRSAGARRQLAAAKSSASMPTTATRKARSPSTIAALTRRFPDIPQTRLGLRVAPAADPGADRGAAAKNSASTTATSPDQATLKAESTRIFNRTFAVTAALNAFTLGVAGIALLTSLLTLAIRACRSWRRCGRSASRGGGWRRSSC